MISRFLLILKIILETKLQSFLGKKVRSCTVCIWFSRYCNVEKYCFKQLVLTAFFISFETIFPSCLQDSYHCKNHRSTVDTCITFVVWYCNTVTDKTQNMLQNFSLCISKTGDLIFWFFLALALVVLLSSYQPKSHQMTTFVQNDKVFSTKPSFFSKFWFEGEQLSFDVSLMRS